MVTKNNNEKIYIGIDDQVIELKGAEKETFLEERANEEAERNAVKLQQEEQKALKVSAYTKLGLTEEEINAIL